ncbi:CHAD domain-containing protein [candidate division KSB1 bacterium]|nr:CHAD domain-containing protein [candidate division KSB1 bacterium]
MLPDGFRDYYQQRAVNIRENYRTAIHYFSEDGVHDLRVEIKRLRAFYNLINWINRNFKAKKRLKPIRRLFKAAGKIRDMHVLQQIARDRSNKENLNIHEFYNLLKHYELEARDDFFKKYKNYDLSILEQNLSYIETALSIIDYEYISHKMHQRLDKMTSELIEFKNHPQLEEADLHKIRILCKESRYVLEIIRSTEEENEKFKILNDKMRAVHQALGKWHDCDVCLHRLKEALNHDTFQMSETKSYEKFASLLESEKVDHIAQFERRWQNFTSETERLNLGNFAKSR